MRTKTVRREQGRFVGWCLICAAACLPGCAHPLADLGTQQTAAWAEFLESAPGAGSLADSPARDEARTAPREFTLARLADKQGQWREAEQLYRHILDEHPDHTAARHRLGVVLARQGKFQDADKHLTIARQAAPHHLPLLCDLGYTYYLDGRLEDAEQTLAAALRLEPHHEAACNNLGLVYGAQGRFAESLEMFRRVGSEPAAQTNLAYMLAQNGEFARAQACLLRALTLDQNLRPAAEALLQVAAHEEAAEVTTDADGPVPPEKTQWSRQPAANPAAAERQPAQTVILSLGDAGPQESFLPPPAKPRQVAMPTSQPAPASRSDVPPAVAMPATARPPPSGSPAREPQPQIVMPYPAQAVQQKPSNPGSSGWEITIPANPTNGPSWSAGPAPAAVRMPQPAAVRMPQPAAVRMPQPAVAHSGGQFSLQRQAQPAERQAQLAERQGQPTERQGQPTERQSQPAERPAASRGGEAEPPRYLRLPGHSDFRVTPWPSVPPIQTPLGLPAWAAGIQQQAGSR